MWSCSSHSHQYFRWSPSNNTAGKPPSADLIRCHGRNVYCVCGMPRECIRERCMHPLSTFYSSVCLLCLSTPWLLNSTPPSNRLRWDNILPVPDRNTHNDFLQSDTFTQFSTFIISHFYQMRTVIRNIINLCFKCVEIGTIWGYGLMNSFSLWWEASWDSSL